MQAPQTDSPASTGQSSPRPHAVVIGSGFGGLAAAIRLGVKGYRVTVLEKLDQPGGRACVHRRDGFTFDAGPTIVTAPFLFEELWTLCGRSMAEDVQLKPLDPFYRIRFQDGAWFDYNGDPAHMRAEVAKFSPGDVAGFERFMEFAHHCYRLGFLELGDKPFESVGDLVAAMPSLVRMRAWRTIYQVVARHIRDPRLRMVMSFHPLLIGGNPFAVTGVYSLIASLERQFGVHWAMGGTGALVGGLAGLVRATGGELRCNAEVARIDVSAGRARGVTLTSGETLPAQLVVSNADAAWTYRKLIAPEHRRVWTDRKVDRAAYSMSLFVWYFGTNRQYPGVPHHMILMGPRYRELLSDIFRRKVLAEDFSLYLHRPTASDPALAPPGCDAFYVLSPVPHLDSGTDWSQAAEPYREAIAQSLHDTVLPGFREHLVTSFCTTPQDFHDRLLSYKGAAFGFEPQLLQSAWFRPHNRAKDIAGLYVVGAGTHPGAGMPGVLSSAKALDSVIPHASLLH
jgi:phytoene desaturase